MALPPWCMAAQCMLSSVVRRLPVRWPLASFDPIPAGLLYAVMDCQNQHYLDRHLLSCERKPGWHAACNQKGIGPPAGPTHGCQLGSGWLHQAAVAGASPKQHSSTSQCFSDGGNRCWSKQTGQHVQVQAEHHGFRPQSRPTTSSLTHCNTTGVDRQPTYHNTTPATDGQVCSFGQCFVVSMHHAHGRFTQSQLTTQTHNETRGCRYTTAQRQRAGVRE